jgi:histone-binding protein RBBP4
MGEPSSSSLENVNNNGTSEAGVEDVLEERMIDAEYKIWKKNTPYLYDIVMTHALEWPSLTCQWLPNIKEGSASSATREHSLLLGTHTTGEPNHLLVCTVHLPTNNQNPIVDNNTNNNGSSTANANTIHTLPASHYDEEKGEVGGFGFQQQTAPQLDGVVEVKMKILHEGEVHRARYCPQDPFVIATKGPSSYVYIYDLSKHPSIPAITGSDVIATPKPNLVLGGHTKDGYGLAWSNHTKGHLISGSLDCTVCYWDIHQTTTSSSSTASSSAADTSLIMDPLCTFTGHTGPVEDVDWHKLDPYLIGSCGDDATVRLWDIRAATSSSSATNKHIVTQEAHAIHKAHDGDVHCLAFHPTNEFLLATGSADRSVVLWDMRNLKSYVEIISIIISCDLIVAIQSFLSNFPFHFCLFFYHLLCTRRLQTLTGHNDQVFQVSWAPFNESILASCSADRRVNIWDLSRIGMEQTPEDAEDGPPELLFIHGGHTSKVNDFSWNIHNPWTIASVSEDNVLQVWTMAEEIYADDDDLEDEEEDESEDENNKKVLRDDELE